MSRIEARESAADDARTISNRLGLGLTVQISTAKTAHPVIWLFAEGRHVGTVTLVKQGSMMTFRASKIVKTYAVATATPATFSDAVRFAGTDVKGQPFKEAA